MANAPSRPRLPIRTYRIPPESFDFDVASDAERAAYGVPRLPNNRELQRKLEAKAKRYHLVVPEFRPRRSGRRTLPGLKVTHPAETTGTWAGGITFPPAGESLSWVEGTWTMPSAAIPPGGPAGSQAIASTWVGLDGDEGSNDVLQAGCDVIVDDSGGGPALKFCPWWEWYPSDSYWITNLGVSQGDVMNCLIRLDPGSQTTATVLLTNETTKVALTFSTPALAGTLLSGNCAEWIVEQLATGPLADFGAVSFTDCNAGSTDGVTVNLSVGNTINMVDANNSLISKSEINDPTSVGITYA